MASVLIQKKKQGQDLALPRTTDKRMRKREFSLAVKKEKPLADRPKFQSICQWLGVF